MKFPLSMIGLIVFLTGSLAIYHDFTIVKWQIVQGIGLGWTMYGVIKNE